VLAVSDADDVVGRQSQCLEYRPERLRSAERLNEKRNLGFPSQPSEIVLSGSGELVREDRPPIEPGHHGFDPREGPDGVGPIVMEVVVDGDAELVAGCGQGHTESNAFRRDTESDEGSDERLVRIQQRPVEIEDRYAIRAPDRVI
jgi:hypothetical protein